jgi:hypothetical protein
MSTPLIDNLWRQFRQKWGNEKNLFPGESETRKGGSSKNGVWKWKMKEWNIEKALTTDENIQCLPSTDTPSNGDLYPRAFQGSSFTSFNCPQPWFWYVSQTTVSPKRFSPVNMLQHEPLRAQSSNVSSAFVKFLCQVTNQSCISSIHTCIIMHFTCSCTQ